MIHFLFATSKNNYHPYILRNKIVSFLVTALLLFNLLASSVWSPFLDVVSAANYVKSEVISGNNQERTKIGLNKLTESSQLNSAAYAKAQDMLSKNYWAHFGPNGESPWQFIAASGFDYLYAGENLAKGYVSVSSMIEAWMNSPTHKANIVKPEYTHIGVAVVDGTLLGESTTLVVVMFGTSINAGGGSQSSSSSVSSSQTTVISQSISQSSTPVTSASSKSATPTVSSASATSKQTVTSKKATLTSTSSSTSIFVKPAPPSPPTITNPVSPLNTNLSEIDITGKATAGNKVEVFQNNSGVGNESVGADGIWIYRAKNLENGDYEYYAIQTDKYDQRSGKSELIKISVNHDVKDANINYVSFEPEITDVNPDQYKIKFSFDDDIIFKDPLPQNVLINYETHNLYIEYKIATPIDTKLQYVDIYGNAKEITIYSQDIIQKIASSFPDNQTVVTEYEVPALAKVASTFISSSIKTRVNLLAGAFMFIIFLADSIILYIKKINILRSRSMLHLGQFGIIILLAIISGLGNIL